MSNNNRYKARTPIKEKVEIPKEPVKEKQETPSIPTKEKAKPGVKDIGKQLDYFMARHHFANGWKREIKEILKPILK